MTQQAHVVYRDYENDIAEQQIGDLPIGITADLMFGGGRRHFVPKEDPESVRMDNRSLIDEAVTSGFRVVTRRAGFDQLQEDSSLPILALLTPDHMSYEIDRDSAQEPSLKEMAQKALSILDYASKNDKNSPGFFLMIEGSRIDMAAHSNDPGAHAREILMYYEVIKLVKQFVKENPDTAMVSTSDHETGGLALARQVSEAYPEYLWKPDQILKQKKSTFTLASQLLAHTVMSSDNEDAANQQRKFVQETIIRGGLGLTDPTEDEFAYLLDTKRTVGQLDYFMGNMASLRGQIGWSTHGHTGVDVNLYAYGRDTNQLHGNRENTEVGAFLASYLDLDKDMDDITEDLKKHEFFKHPDIPILRTRRHHNDESIH